MRNKFLPSQHLLFLPKKTAGCAVMLPSPECMVMIILISRMIYTVPEVWTAACGRALSCGGPVASHLQHFLRLWSKHKLLVSYIEHLLPCTGRMSYWIALYVLSSSDNEQESRNAVTYRLLSMESTVIKFFTKRRTHISNFSCFENQ